VNADAIDENATSTLRATPLTWWLARGYARRLDGTLVLEEPDGSKHAIHFGAGVRLKVRTATPIAGLDAAEPLAGQRERLLEQLVWLGDRPPATQLAFFAGNDYLLRGTDSTAVLVNPHELIWSAVRRQARTDDVEAAMAELRERTLSISAEAPIDEFHFGGVEHTIVDVLRACPLRGADLLGSGLGAEPQIARLLYALELTGCLTTVTRAVSGVAPRREPFPLGAAVEPPSLPDPAEAMASASEASAEPVRTALSFRPSSIPPASVELVELQEELRQRVDNPPSDHYAVLGIDPQASGSEVRVAAQALLVRWDPGRLGHAPAELRGLAALVQALVAEAYGALSEPFTRAAYNAGLSARSVAPPDQARLALAFRRMVGVRRIEALFAQGKLDAAEREVIRAIGNDTTQHELIALHLWIRAHDPMENLARLLARLDRTLEGAPETAKLHWYRGLLLKKMGKHASALQEFRSAVDLDPRHTDAAREVRLYEMTREEWLSQPARKGSGTFPKTESGLLRRLLGNKD
jgi:tetratricopeptide (TPR) repeat protein